MGNAGPPRGGGGGAGRAVVGEEKHNSGVEESVIYLTFRKDI
jgi:hypothetical protein